jgi:hypothetical protein
MRRISMYGALQLAFTVICCTVFLPTYFSYWLALAFQVGGWIGHTVMRNVEWSLVEGSGRLKSMVGTVGARQYQLENSGLRDVAGLVGLLIECVRSC